MTVCLWLSIARGENYYLRICYYFHFTAAVDVEAIVKERDFKTLERNLVNLTFCNVELEVSNNIDDAVGVMIFIHFLDGSFRLYNYGLDVMHQKSTNPADGPRLKY